MGRRVRVAIGLGGLLVVLLVEVGVVDQLLLQVVVVAVLPSAVVLLVVRVHVGVLVVPLHLPLCFHINYIVHLLLLLLHPILPHIAALNTILALQLPTLSLCSHLLLFLPTLLPPFLLLFSYLFPYLLSLDLALLNHFTLISSRLTTIALKLLFNLRLFIPIHTRLELTLLWLVGYWVVISVLITKV